MNEELKQLTQTVLSKLTTMLENASTLEVRTFVADGTGDIGQYNPETHEFLGAKLAAYTRLELDGDQVNLLPEQLDSEMQKFHAAAVAQAQENRQAVFEMVLGVLNLGQKSGASAKK